jgi:hypothetical protein
LAKYIEPAPIKKDEENPFESMRERFYVAAQYLELEKGSYHYFITPVKQVITSIPIQLDEIKI